MPPRPNDRSITTCRSCRRRKIRCDRVRPRCNRCRESGAACVYEDQIPQPAPSYQFVEETPGAPAGSSRRSSHGTEQPSIVTISADRLQNIEARVETLSQMVRTLQAQSATGSAGQQSTSHSTPDVSSASIQEPEPTSVLTGHLSIQENGSVRYVEPSFFATMCKEVAELDELLGSQARYLRQPAEPAYPESDEDERPISDFEEGSAPTQRREAAARPAPGRRTSTNDYMWIGGHGSSAPMPAVARTVAQHPTFLQRLPSKAQCDILVENYVQGYHPIAPMVHIPTFRQRYAEFWRTKDDPTATSTASMSMVSLLIAICYAGSVSCPVRADGQAGSSVPEEVKTHLHKLGKKALNFAHFPRVPILDTFMAYVILQQTIMREEEPLTSMAFVGLMLRVANVLGLHRDPSHFGSDITPIEAETRRRVWWQVVHVDVLVAMAAGVPPLIELNSWDVKGISELKEEFIGTEVGTRYEMAVKSGQRRHDAVEDPLGDPSYRSMVSTASIMAAGKLRYSLVLRRTFARLFSSSPLTTSSLVDMRSEFRMLTEDLSWRISRIPDSSMDSATNNPRAGSYENNPALNRWARLLLSLFIDEKYCLVCHPVLKTPVSEVWDDLYQQAIERCQSFCMKCAQLSSVEAFRQYNWSWPGNHQPLHAVMILLVDLIESPQSEYALLSRRVVDIVFALLGPMGGLVAGTGPEDNLMKRPLSDGQETWLYLRRLRSKAWDLAGIDPSIVWTREQAIQYCNNPNQSQMLFSDDPGPMWSQASPEMLEDMEGLSVSPGGPAFESMGDVVMSPPNIDWSYLDAVLGSDQGGMDLGLGAGEDDDSGS